MKTLTSSYKNILPLTFTLVILKGPITSAIKSTITMRQSISRAKRKKMNYQVVEGRENSE
jgi:hypothetical protein